MSIPLSYVSVIIIWSTTPLGIQWSGEQVGYEFGVAARMLIGLALLTLIVRLRRMPMPFTRDAWQVYLLGGIPLFIAMTSVYWSAQYIPSGWISVIFGLSPIMTSVLAVFLLKESAFADGKLYGMLLGLGGLSLVFRESLLLGDSAWLGVLAVLVSVSAHSPSAVLLKRKGTSIPAISVTTGALLIATPLFWLNLMLGPGLPSTLPERAMWAIVYLGVMGSAIGFPLYYYLLSKLSAGRLALITLITPVTALLLGNRLNGEVISADVWGGTALILCGLAIYEFGHRFRSLRRISRRLALRWRQRPM